ncbi:MAG: N-acetylmuramoyl-L-alanine amidase [Hyphomonadaceae bacterium]
MLRIIRVLFGVFSLFLLCFAANADVHSVAVQGDGVNTRIVISADTQIFHDEFLNNLSGAALIVDVDNKPWTGPAIEFSPKAGVRNLEWVDGQLVFWLDGPMMIARASDLPPYGRRASHRLVIDLVSVSSARYLRAAKRDTRRLESLRLERRLASAESPRRVEAGGQRYVVVIDPGHGGADPGTSHHGAVERTIVLEAAQKLKTMLDSNPLYDVRLTRSEDTFIELEDRVKLARDWDADLFISIHADAAGTPNVRGAGVYTLSAKGQERVDSTARGQNWELPIETGEAPDEVVSILGEFLKRETHSNSEKFASLLIPELGRAGPILRNTHRSENFFVLLAPDVPAVLLEMGFLTNQSDARRLSSAEGQRKTMAAVAQAIDVYFEQQAVLMAQN